MITETITGCLAKSGQPDASAEGNIDCDLGIYAFGFHTDLQSKRKINKKEEIKS